jgi:hypothetical protein
MQDIVAATFELVAQNTNSSPIEAFADGEVQHANTRVGELGAMRGRCWANHGQIDAGLLQADERRRRRPIRVLGNAQRLSRHDGNLARTFHCTKSC